MQSRIPVLNLKQRKLIWRFPFFHLKEGDNNEKKETYII